MKKLTLKRVNKVRKPKKPSFGVNPKFIKTRKFFKSQKNAIVAKIVGLLVVSVAFLAAGSLQAVGIWAPVLLTLGTLAGVRFFAILGDRFISGKELKVNVAEINEWAHGQSILKAEYKKNKAAWKAAKVASKLDKKTDKATKNLKAAEEKSITKAQNEKAAIERSREVSKAYANAKNEFDIKR